MSEDARLALVERFFRGTGATYDAVVHLATLGIDSRWKRRIVDRIPPQATRILDLACGTGISTIAIARRFPQARVVGVELREEYLAHARRKVAAAGLTNVALALSRAEDYVADEPFDCVASSYLAKYADLPRLARSAGELLKAGGVFIAHDFTFPPGRARVALFRLYFFLLQGVGGALLPAWREIYYGLPRLIEESRWLSELPPALAHAGFRDIRTAHLALYGSAIVSARKMGSDPIFPDPISPRQDDMQAVRGRGTLRRR